MRNFLLFIVSCAPYMLSGQNALTSDTLTISEIMVRSSSKPSVLNGFMDQTIDSTVLKDYRLCDISSVISENTTLSIKDYGPGAISTISFRGMGASHTQLLWNDISINSPMLGEADLSLVPAGFIDEIRILGGAASMITGSGGLGGTVNCLTGPDWKNETNLLLNGGAGSFGTYSGMLSLRTGTDRFQSVTRGYILSSENNFKYLNDAGSSGPVMERRTNDEASKYDLMQEFYFRGEKSVTSAAVWYSFSDRQLPSNMLVAEPPGSEKQKDESLRTVISHDRNIGNVSIEASVAWFSDRLLYINIPASINSNNRSNTLFARAAAETPAGKKNLVKVVLNNELELVNSVNYSDFKSRNISTVSVSDRTVLSKNLGFSVLVRDIADNGKILIPDFSTGVDLKIAQKKDAFIRLNFSRNSKVPTMNDLYWNPGGNQELKNEYSYSGELSFDMKNKLSERIELDPELTLYSSEIMDMIEWIPGESSIWSPLNISKVAASGVETGFGIGVRSNRTSLRLKLQYSLNYTHSLDGQASTDFRQLIYVPQNQLNLSLGIDYGNLYATFLTDFTGKRYTESDDSKYLPAYILNNIITGFRIKPGVNSFIFCLKAENIFNVRYQAIAYYPLPGRSFMFSVTYQFIKTI
jgi:vitamin B12 transporter